MIASQNKYMIVRNRRIPTYDSLHLIERNVKVDSISVTLPEWFRTYGGKKIIKIYGTQVYQLNAAKILLDYEFEPNLALELTLHSNVAKDNYTGTLLEPYPLVPEVWDTHNKSPDKWLPTVPAKDNINNIFEGYVLTANNF
jgi:hypothetical protein